MSAPNVLVNFRLEKDRPLKFRWQRSDGTPGDGWKAQITAVKLADGKRLAMDKSAILEKIAPTDEAGVYALTFNGMVGFGADHPDHGAVEAMTDQEIEYELELVHDESGRVAGESDVEILDRPPAMARKLPGK